MRARLAGTTPGVEPLAGRAEHIPVPDGDVDAVMAGQAYHWFDREPAHREIARVLKSGGVFAPIWNIRDDSVPWVAQLSEILGATDHEGRLDGDFGPEFGPASLTYPIIFVGNDFNPVVVMGLQEGQNLYATPEMGFELRFEHRFDKGFKVLPEAYFNFRPEEFLNLFWIGFFHCRVRGEFALYPGG